MPYALQRPVGVQESRRRGREREMEVAARRSGVRPGEFYEMTDAEKLQLRRDVRENYERSRKVENLTIGVGKDGEFDKGTWTPTLLLDPALSDAYVARPVCIISKTGELRVHRIGRDEFQDGIDAWLAPINLDT